MMVRVVWRGARGGVDADVLPTDHLAPHDVELRADWAHPVRLANLSPRGAAMGRSEPSPTARQGTIRQCGCDLRQGNRRQNSAAATDSLSGVSRGGGKKEKKEKKKE